MKSKKSSAIYIVILVVAIAVILAAKFAAPQSTGEISSAEDDSYSFEFEEFDETELPATESETESHAEETEKETEKASSSKKKESSNQSTAKEKSSSATQKKNKKTTAVTQKKSRKYYFRNTKLLDNHYEKHGREMGFANAENYEKAASDVINNPAALSKLEQSENDGDTVFFVEKTGELVILSADGYIRTYFITSKAYFDRT